jgi:hypothetical protein
MVKRPRNRLTYGKKDEKELAGWSTHYGDKGEENLDHGDKDKKEMASGEKIE